MVHGHQTVSVQPLKQAASYHAQTDTFVGAFTLQAHKKADPEIGQFLLVPSARLELAQLSPLPPQDSVSTNFTTTAFKKTMDTGSNRA
jgi:hypothetical protein